MLLVLPFLSWAFFASAANLAASRALLICSAETFPDIVEFNGYAVVSRKYGGVGKEEGNKAENVLFVSSNCIYFIVYFSV
ncbi:hypothetical protein BX667DRAFT_500377 [Coemansia mojavensis]|nr:hypothetical protein BX667DRAFT_500377 [Coemansia mojavensis]